MKSLKLEAVRFYFPNVELNKYSMFDYPVLFIRSSVEYCSPVLSPFHDNAVTRIEAIQQKFVRTALMRLTR